MFNELQDFQEDVDLEDVAASKGNSLFSEVDDRRLQVGLIKLGKVLAFGLLFPSNAVFLLITLILAQ
jgi:hypothetical protein